MITTKDELEKMFRDEIVKRYSKRDDLFNDIPQLAHIVLHTIGCTYLDKLQPTMSGKEFINYLF